MGILGQKRRLISWSNLVAALVAVLLVLGALPANAISDPYDEDPIGLVPFRDSVHSVYSGGEDTWEVWICDVPNWSAPVEVGSVTAQLNEKISPYFLWLSGGRYRPVFRVGGTVSSFDVIDEDPSVSGFPERRLLGCEDAVFKASTTSPNGVLIIADGGFGEGYGLSGFLCPPPLTGCTDVFPSNRRIVVVGAGSVTASGSFPARLKVVAHEIGHALEWPHSYGGLTTRSDGSVNQYDNISDVMSGAAIEGDPIGTHAYNRYSAGWIDSEEVVSYQGGTHTYLLQPIGGEGDEMLTIPVSKGYTYTFGLRDPVAWDDTIAKFGIEAYVVDSRPEVCTFSVDDLSDHPCFGVSARITPVPAPTAADDTSHVHSVGESFVVGSWQLTVLQDIRGGIHLRVTDGLYNGRFVDDDGNPHEADIEAVAAAGLTKGCDPPANDRYCPSDTVSRAAMAAFLSRALGEPTVGSTHQGYFSDVPPDAWFASDVERLYELGITTGYADGTFRPNSPVNRAEMAAFIARTFNLDFGDGSSQTFQDVGSETWFAPHVEALEREGITNGCNSSPPLYCPLQAVPREQMASFLARSLQLSS